MINSDAPVDSVNTLQYGSSNIGRNTKPPCLPHHSQPPTAVSIKPFSSPTVDEAQQALEAVMDYIKNQQITLDLSEGMLLGKLMERLNTARGQTSTVPADFLWLEDKLNDGFTPQK